MQRRLLGAELLRLRELADLTQDEAAAHIGKAGNKISRVEYGKVGIDKTDLDALMGLYKASEKDQGWHSGPWSRDTWLRSRQRSMPRR
jgi:transcriptional regulator with XRE-family HTH domain